jgi:YD repeat-containing protein
LTGIAYRTNACGRAAYRQQNNCAGLTSLACVEAYSYTQSGHIIPEELTAFNTAQNAAQSTEARFTYDNEGRMTSVT